MLQAMISLIGIALHIDGAGNEMPPKAKKGENNASPKDGITFVAEESRAVLASQTLAALTPASAAPREDARAQRLRNAGLAVSA